MDLTALITCKDRDLNLRYCLESIKHSSLVPEVVLVDFGSTTSLEPLQEMYPFLHVIRTTNNTKDFHKARAINIGLKAIETKYTCITDADQIFSKNFFETVQSELYNNKKAFVLCASYFLSNIPNGFLPKDIGSKFDKLLDLAKREHNRHGDGCCNGFWTKWGMHVHGYDEDYKGFGAEDSDFSRRSMLSGLKRIRIHNKVSMIHLPHPRTGAYYHPNTLHANRVKYLTKGSTKQITANVGVPWGVL